MTTSRHYHSQAAAPIDEPSYPYLLRKMCYYKSILENYSNKTTYVPGHEKRWLLLSGSRITDREIPEIIQFLEKHTEIAYLDLSRNQITFAGLAMLASKASQIEILDVSSNRITECYTNFKNVMTACKQINISHNPLGDEGVVAIARSFSLVSLDACYTGLTDKGAMSLANLNHLKIVKIDWNQVTNLGARMLAERKENKLESLSMKGNKIDDIIVYEVLKREIRVINLEYNKIPDQKPASCQPVKPYIPKSDFRFFQYKEDIFHPDYIETVRKKVKTKVEKKKLKKGICSTGFVQ